MMQRYIEQLLEDLQNAHRLHEPEPEVEEEQSIEQHLAEVERWLASDPEHTFSYYSGIQKDVFPPVERLSQQQLEQLVKTIKQLLLSWNIDVDIPKEVGCARAYTLMLQVFDRKVEIVNGGFVTIEFCTYRVEVCPFEEHCMCRKFEDKDTNNDESLTTGLPF